MDPVTAVILGTGALLQYLGGRQASRASQRAALTQQQASEQAIGANERAQENALNFYRDMWTQSQQNLAPYVQLGHSAVGALGNLTGIMPNVGPGANYSGAPGKRPMPGSQPGRGPTLGLFGNPAGSYSAPQMVTMIGPDGSQRQVPRTMVPHYQQRGARVVNG